jgi:predicted nucleic acid-binding protein
VSWLLDSDVLSQPAKKVGDARVITWLEKHQDQCYTSSIVIAQLAFWVRTKRGKQRVALHIAAIARRHKLTIAARHDPTRPL